MIHYAKFIVLFISLMWLWGLSSCSYPTPEESFRTHVVQLDSTYCHLFSQEAILSDTKAAFLENPIPDSLFWENRNLFLATAKRKLVGFKYLPEKEMTLQTEWLNRLEQIIPSTSIVDIYDRQAVLEHLLSHSMLTELNKLQAFNYQLRTYPFLLDNLKSNLQKKDIPKLDYLEAQLSETYFLLTEKLPQITRLEHQETHIQLALEPKIEAARLAIKDLLAFCRSFKNEHAEQQ